MLNVLLGSENMKKYPKVIPPKTLIFKSKKILNMLFLLQLENLLLTVEQMNFKQYFL